MGGIDTLINQQLLERMTREASAKYARLRGRMGQKTTLKNAVRFTLNEFGVRGGLWAHYYRAVSRKLSERGGAVTAKRASQRARAKQTGTGQ
ncbi:MAG: hypothetical protein HY457_01305 [Parcubacteria group bacterium]|nr:hypothetical protein [Parcubacteria group bacterium]